MGSYQCGLGGLARVRAPQTETESAVHNGLSPVLTVVLRRSYTVVKAPPSGGCFGSKLGCPPHRIFEFTY